MSTGGPSPASFCGSSPDSLLDSSCLAEQKCRNQRHIYIDGMQPRRHKVPVRKVSTTSYLQASDIGHETAAAASDHSVAASDRLRVDSAFERVSNTNTRNGMRFRCSNFEHALPFFFDYVSTTLRFFVLGVVD